MPDFSKPVLAFDTALNGCVVAVYDPVTEKSVVRVLETEREQAAKLVPLIQYAMSEAGIQFSDLGLIVTTVGPGSFTGLRISLSTARSFGLSLGIPIQGVSTFAAMAATCGLSKDTLVLLESKRVDYYAQRFDAAGREKGPAFCADVHSLLEQNDHSICGDAVTRFQAEAGEAFKGSFQLKTMLDAAILAKLGYNLFKDAGGRADKPEPVYLRGADVSVSNKTQRKIKYFPD